MSEKDFSIKTKFYNWLEQCPLDRWQPVDERQYTDHKAVTIKFKIPDSDQIDFVDQVSVHGSKVGK